MDFAEEFISAEIKYDFQNEKNRRETSKKWIDCRLNIKPLEESACLEILCYPKKFTDQSPYFTFRFDISDVKFGPLHSNTKNTAYGIFWTRNARKCRLFFSLDDNVMYTNYKKYLKNVFCSLEQFKRDREVDYVNMLPFSLNLSFNDGLVEVLNSTETIMQNPKDISKFSSRKRYSDVSYYEVFQPHQSTITNIPKADRAPVLTFSRHKKNISDETKLRKAKTKNRKRSIWNLLKTKRDKQFTSSLQQHYEKNLQIALLNEHWMQEIELKADDAVLNDVRVSDIFKQIGSHSATCSPTWTENLVISGPQSRSSFNLSAINTNKEHSKTELHTERDSEDNQVIPIKRRIKFSISSMDEDGYAVMRPLMPQGETSYENIQMPRRHSKRRSHIENNVAKNINFQRDYECHLGLAESIETIIHSDDSFDSEWDNTFIRSNNDNPEATYANTMREQSILSSRLIQQDQASIISSNKELVGSNDANDVLPLRSIATELLRNIPKNSHCEWTLQNGIKITTGNCLYIAEMVDLKTNGKCHQKQNAGEKANQEENTSLQFSNIENKIVDKQIDFEKVNIAQNQNSTQSKVGTFVARITSKKQPLLKRIKAKCLQLQNKIKQVSNRKITADICLPIF